MVDGGGHVGVEEGGEGRGGIRVEGGLKIDIVFGLVKQQVEITAERGLR